MRNEMSYELHHCVETWLSKFEIMSGSEFSILEGREELIKVLFREKETFNQNSYCDLS